MSKTFYIDQLEKLGINIENCIAEYIFISSKGLNSPSFVVRENRLEEKLNREIHAYRVLETRNGLFGTSYRFLNDYMFEENIKNIDGNNINNDWINFFTEKMLETSPTLAYKFTKNLKEDEEIKEFNS